MFPNRGVSHFFSGTVQIVSPTLSGLFLVGALNRPRERKRTNRAKSPDHPRANRENPRKIGKVPKRTKKDKKGRTSPDRETPRLKPPRLAALDCGAFDTESLNLRGHFRGRFCVCSRVHFHEQFRKRVHPEG